MKVRLMFENKDFSAKAKLPFAAKDLLRDLSLGEILKTMSKDDEQILLSCKQALLSPLQSKAEIIFRQENLKTALQYPAAIRQLYQIAGAVFQKQRSSWYLMSSWLPTNAVELLEIYIGGLQELQKFSAEWGGILDSSGFKRLLQSFQEELTSDYFSEIREELKFFSSKNGFWIGASFGSYLQGQKYQLLKKEKHRFSLSFRKNSYTLAPRDDLGAKDFGQRKERAKNEAENALAQAAEHLGNFFRLLCEELAFYIGAINLAEELQERGLSYSFPVVSDDRTRSAEGLSDMALALTINNVEKVIANDLPANEARLTIITGANQGGKSTFLRSLGQAQVMTQAGLFVAAEKLTFPICKGIFSHFKREEDKSMVSGKLDEELARMNQLVEHLEKESLVIFNESFAASNERESSEISRQVTLALIESGVEVFFVTHLYSFASSLQAEKNNSVLCLRAERLDGGKRSFKIKVGEPQKTAFGLDLYRKIFDEENLK